jgi:hypothetical protein
MAKYFVDAIHAVFVTMALFYNISEVRGGFYLSLGRDTSGPYNDGIVVGV